MSPLQNGQRGLDTAWLTGSKSVPPPESLRSGPEAQQLEWFNFMRAVDLAVVMEGPDVTAEEYKLLAGMQLHFRSMDNAEVYRTFFGDGGGISMERLGLDPESADAFVIDKSKGKEAFWGGGISDAELDTEIRIAEKAMTEAQSLAHNAGKGRLYDADSGVGVRYEVFTQDTLGTMAKEASDTAFALIAQKDARAALNAWGDSVGSVAIVLGGGDEGFPSDAESLADKIENNSGLITMKTSELASLDTDYWSNLAQEVRDKGDDIKPIELLTIFTKGTQNAAALLNQGAARTSNVPIDQRLAATQEQSRRTAQMRDAIEDIYHMLEDKEGFRAAHAALPLRQYLLKFDDMPNETANDRMYRAIALWSAGAQAYDR